jgi:hypothetical protein
MAAFGFPLLGFAGMARLYRTGRKVGIAFGSPAAVPPGGRARDALILQDAGKAAP